MLTVTGIGISTVIVSLRLSRWYLCATYRSVDVVHFPAERHIMPLGTYVLSHEVLAICEHLYCSVSAALWLSPEAMTLMPFLDKHCWLIFHFVFLSWLTFTERWELVFDIFPMWFLQIGMNTSKYKEKVYNPRKFL